jgi:outer membrane protein OmpA-like peptidoglycan-associated protein
MLVMLTLSLGAVARAQDAEGSKDHPLLSRMPGYFIAEYSGRDFDRHEFALKDEKTAPVEGRMTVIQYQIKEGAKQASVLQIIRNCQNSLARLGGKVLHERLEGAHGTTTMQLSRAGEEVWIDVTAANAGFDYTINVVEKAGMKQDVVSAEQWSGDLRDAGHTAVYGILFDTDKSDIKPESEAALKEIAKLLGQDSALALRVVGHTDATGDFTHNLQLSEARAKAVVTALSSRFGVNAARLSAHGVGQLCPVASNDTDEGRARNRRVELVKR